MIERVAGGVVLLFVSLYVASLRTGRNRSHPGRHVRLVIGGSFVMVPYVFLTSPAWYSLPIQIAANTLVLLLDWFSFHEDKTRFSEADLCLTGPCRRNARITGHLAHWGDVVGVLLLLLLNTDRSNWPILVAAFATYGVVGSRFVEHMTRDGSVSDLRGMTESEKCAQARLMRDGWRGGLNDLITVLGVVVLWQTLFTCGDGRCEGLLAPLKVLRSTATDAFDGADTKGRKALSSMRLAFTALTTVVPTYSNYVNTAAQHGQLPAALYGLPACFDD